MDWVGLVTGLDGALSAFGAGSVVAWANARRNRAEARELAAGEERRAAAARAGKFNRAIAATHRVIDHLDVYVANPEPSCEEEAHEDDLMRVELELAVRDWRESMAVVSPLWEAPAGLPLVAVGSRERRELVGVRVELEELAGRLRAAR